jgi:hypothetical protein
MSAVSGTRTIDSSTDTHMQVRSSWLTDALVIASMLATGGLLVAYLLVALNWLSLPFTGAMFSENLVVEDVEPFSGEAWNALEAGVRPGDTLARIGRRIPASKNSVAPCNSTKPETAFI